MRHLRAVPVPDLPTRLDEVIDHAARRYYERTFRKPGRLNYEALDNDTKAEFRDHVRPIVEDALETAVDCGLHTMGDTW